MHRTNAARRGSAVFASVALLAAAAPALAIDTYVGEDLQSVDDAVLASHPNADAARASFLARLSSSAVDGFESQPGASSPIPLSWGAVTGTATGGGDSFISVSSTDNSGRYALEGSQYVRVNPDTIAEIQVVFSAPQNAFGCFTTDIGDDIGVGHKVRITLLRSSGPNTLLDVAVTRNTTGGNVHFFGVVDDATPFTGVRIGFDSEDGDAFGVDGLVIGAVGASGPPPTVKEYDAYFLPRSVVFHTDAKRPERSYFKATGVFDTGSAGGDLAAPSTVTIGNVEIGIPQDGLVFDPKVKGLRYVNGALDFQVVPNRSGSSKAKFKVILKQDPATVASPGEELTLSYEGGGIEALGTVLLDEKGNYRLARTRGDLVEPDLVFYRLNAKAAGPGKDSLRIKAGMATGGFLPDTAPDVTIQIPGGIDESLPSSAFRKKGHRYVYTSKGPGLTKVDLDFDRERAEFVGAKSAIGEYDDGAVPFEIRIVVGGADRTVKVRAFHDAKRKTLKY